MEEALVFSCAQSSPLCEEAIVWADVGTAHSAVVTGVDRELEACVSRLA